MLIKSLLKGLSTSILLSAAFFANADEYTITFDESGLHGQTGSGNDAGNYGTLLDNEYGAGGINTLPGVDITFWAQTSWSRNSFLNGANNLDSSNADLFLTLFNSDQASNANDADLLVDQGNLAIIHERPTECSVANNQCIDPDDRYSSSNVHGGFMFIQFSQPVSVHSIGLADIESGSDQRGKFAFINSAGDFLGYKGMTVTGDGEYTEQDTYGNSNQPLMSSFGDTISYIVVKMIGSGGINNIKISKTITQVPEPTALAILGVGLLMMGRRRKRML